MFLLRRAHQTLPRGLTMGVRSEHTLPELPYASNALEPVISCEIMEIHHKKHHATYVTNLNNAEAQLKEAVNKCDIAKVISLQNALRFNGGGHLNHSIFWKNLSPNGGQPSQELMGAICESFGGLDNMKNQLMVMSTGIQGSGWGWLGYNKTSKKLQLATCANQDPLQPTTGLIPLFGIDVWEHAYYLQYKNARAEYTKKIFDIMNWNDINERFAQAKC